MIHLGKVKMDYKGADSEDTMKDAIVVGEAYHFWLNSEEDVYDQKYGKNEFK